MASRGDIEAGKAFITLYIKNSLLMKGLNDIKQRMQGLGSSIMGIGGALVAWVFLPDVVAAALAQGCTPTSLGRDLCQYRF